MNDVFTKFIKKLIYLLENDEFFQVIILNIPCNNVKLCDIHQHHVYNKIYYNIPNISSAYDYNCIKDTIEFNKKWINHKLYTIKKGFLENYKLLISFEQPSENNIVPLMTYECKLCIHKL